jgi:hypothetical protein
MEVAFLSKHSPFLDLSVVLSGPPTNLAQTYNHQEKTPGHTVPKIVLNPWTKIAIIP